MHAQPELVGRTVLPRPDGAQGRHDVLGRHVPHLHAQPRVPTGLRLGRGGGRALVDPHLHPAPRGRRTRAAGGGHRLACRGLRWRRTTPSRVADTAFGPVGLVAPLVPDVTLVHGAVADHDGNVALSEPLLEGAWGAWAARRGVVATVECVVDSLDGLGHRVKIPAHRVLAVVEAPFGAHPGGLYAPGIPVSSYGEDIPFWTEARAATRQRPRRLGPALGARAGHPRRVPRAAGARAPRLVVGAHRPGVVAPGRRGPPRRHATAVPPSTWEHAAAYGAREVEVVAGALGADAVLAGAGVANLAAWVAVARARAGGERDPAHRRARPVGLHTHAGRPLHLQPPRVPRHPDARRRLHGAGHGRRGPRHAHHRLSGRGAGRPGREPQLDPHPRRALPGGIGWRQRRGQPGRSLRGGGPGAARPTGASGWAS